MNISKSTLFTLQRSSSIISSIKLQPTAAAINNAQNFKQHRKTFSVMTPLPSFTLQTPKQLAINQFMYYNSSTNDNDKKQTRNIKSIVGRKLDPSEHSLPHKIWTEEEVEAVDVTHKPPEGISDRMAFWSVQFFRKTFDILSGYTIGNHLKTLDERMVLNRCIFLETVAGVPGFSAAMIRHLNSLRRMEVDHGWIHTLLEEAENERMHLMTFTQLRKPGPMFRGLVIISQYLFTVGFSFAYLISPKFCHRFVGYLEEQAVITYTHILDEIDAGRLPMMEVLPAPQVAIDYWELGNAAMMRDVFLAVRADEAHHRDVNHTLSSMNLKDNNPFPPGH